MRRAEVIVALSEFTRREIERFYPWARRKTVVIYPGIDRAFNLTEDGGDEAARQAYAVTSAVPAGRRQHSSAQKSGAVAGRVRTAAR